MSPSPDRAPSWDDESDFLGQDSGAREVDAGSSAPIPHGAHRAPPSQPTWSYEETGRQQLLHDEHGHEFHGSTASQEFHGAAVYSEDGGATSTEGAGATSTEYAALPGLPGRGLTLVILLVTGGVASLNFVLTGGLSFFFDICFVVIGLVCAMAVRRYDIFTAGVLPPLAFAAVFATVAVAAPQTLAAEAGFSTAFMTGLAEHAEALVAGYGLALLTVGGRVLSTAKR